MITRLDEDLASLQTTWSIVAIGVFIATLLIVQRAPDLARYRWSFLLAGVVLLLLPMLPGIGCSVGGARIWVNLGPINFQPGEFAKLLLAMFFAGYLAENRELIAESTWRVGPLRLPEPRHLLPILLAWGFTVVVMVVRARPRLVAAVLRPVRRDALGRHRADQLPRHRRGAVRRRGVHGVADVRSRAGPRRRSGSTRGPTASTRATRSSRRCSASPTAASAAPGSASAAPTRCPRRRTTSSSRRSARSSVVGAAPC